MKPTLPAIAALLLAGCTAAPPTLAPAPDLAAEEKIIRNEEAAWSAELASNNIDKQMTHYTADAVLIAPGAPVMKGAEAIRASMAEMMKDPNMHIEFATERVDVSIDATLATTEGSFKSSMTDPKTKRVFHDAGAHATGYGKQEGKWLAVIDISSSGGPVTSAGN